MTFPIAAEPAAWCVELCESSANARSMSIRENAHVRTPQSSDGQRIRPPHLHTTIYGTIDDADDDRFTNFDGQIRLIGVLLQS